MNWIDRLPSNERRKLRKRMRSPEEYERLRERVKGPEDLEREMEKNEALAELKFAMETEPQVKERLKEAIERDLREHGPESIVEGADLSPGMLEALDSGAFDVRVDTDKDSGQEHMVLLPEGNVAEKIPLQQNVTERYSAAFQGGGLQGVTVEIRIDGELCGYIEMHPDMSEEAFIASVRSDPDILKCLGGRAFLRYEYEPGRLLNVLT